MARSDATILVLPGGGYHRHAPHEAEPIADWLTGLGWRARVVRYPVGVRHPEPLDAIRREVAAERERGARQVGVIGFSAGGHLAGHAALAPSTPAERPDFAVLCYPVVSMTTQPHVGSRTNLFGDDDAAIETAVRTASLERLVRPDAPPFFVWHTAADPVVPSAHTYVLAMALAAAGVDHEAHVFPGDVHGIGLGAGTDAAAWTDLCASWLARR